MKSPGYTLYLCRHRCFCLAQVEVLVTVKAMSLHRAVQILRRHMSCHLHLVDTHIAGAIFIYITYIMNNANIENCHISTYTFKICI